MNNLGAYPYLILAPLVWIALRLGPRAVARRPAFPRGVGHLGVRLLGWFFREFIQVTTLLGLLVFLWVATLMSMALAITVMNLNRGSRAEAPGSLGKRSHPATRNPSPGQKQPSGHHQSALFYNPRGFVIR